MKIPTLSIKCVRFLALLLLGCFALLPSTEAVSPPPDGGYPGGNTAEGQNALLSLTSGTYNTAVGLYSLLRLTGGNYNTGVGAATLVSNTAGQNTACGAGALWLNTTGGSNTATGTFALRDNTTGSENTATGYSALFSNTTGFWNTATGTGALNLNTTGIENTAVGMIALFSNTTGSANTAVGFSAGGGGDGDGNTAIGLDALFGNETGGGNTAVGVAALFNHHTGNNNTAIGLWALGNNGSGDDNVALGDGAGSGVTAASDVICIGANVAGDNVSNACFIGNIRDVTTQNADALPVVIDSAGQLGTASSSRRFKKEIKPMNKASEAVLALEPVTFHYKSDKKDTPQFGLIAEEVAKVNPDLVVRDENGEIYTVRYEAVNAMLLNEFLKEHRKNEEQEATIARQQKQIDALTAGLQKVSAQLESSKPAPQVVNNP